MHPVLRLGLLLTRVESVETRKKFQKIVHILQVMGAPFPEKFSFHLYGPYSADLRAELDAFIAEGLISETEKAPAFVVAPTQKLKDLLAEAAVVPPESAKWLGWAVALNKLSPQKLEGISTLLFLHQKDWPVSTWETKFKELKGHMADKYSELKKEADRFLQLAKA